MEVVAHDAVGEDPHRNARGGLGDYAQECPEVARFVKQRFAVVPAIDDVLHESIR